MIQKRYETLILSQWDMISIPLDEQNNFLVIGVNGPIRPVHIKTVQTNLLGMQQSEV